MVTRTVMWRYGVASLPTNVLKCARLPDSVVFEDGRKCLGFLNLGLPRATFNPLAGD